MKDFTLTQLKQAILKKGYKWLDDGQQDCLNIIGVRNSSTDVNKFNDKVYIAYIGAKNDGSTVEVLLEFSATTKPGTYWLNNPGSAAVGTAILVEGQYIDSWAIGLHQGRYEALTQIKSVKLYRDKNKDSKLDYTNIQDSGLVGINIHRANEAHESVQVDKWSAGCQVIADPGNFATLMRLAHASSKIRGNKFTYTLLKETDLD